MLYPMGIGINDGILIAANCHHVPNNTCDGKMTLLSRPQNNIFIAAPLHPQLTASARSFHPFCHRRQTPLVGHPLLSTCILHSMILQFYLVLLSRLLCSGECWPRVEVQKDGPAR